MLIINTDSILKYRQLTHQICFLPNSNALERSIFIPNFHARIMMKNALKKIHSGLYIFASDDENPYPVRNTPHLACATFNDHVTVDVVTAHCMAACVSTITSPRSGPALPQCTHTYKHTLWVVDWLSLKPDMLYVSECRPALAHYRMLRHSCLIKQTAGMVRRR